MTGINAAQWMAGALKGMGVDDVFVLCGNGMHSFLEACRGEGLGVIGCHNEQAAAYMADARARLTGTLGVVAVSSGPGHLNAMVGAANAFWDGSPLLLISGSSLEETRDRGHFQELDQVGTVEPFCKYAARVSQSQQLPHMLRRAVSSAVSGRPGPAHLTVPADVFAATMEGEPVEGPGGYGPELARVTPGGMADGAGIRRAAEMLRHSGRPLLLAGNGLHYARGAEALERFAEQTDIPIISPLWERGVVERPLPQYMGVTDPWGEASPAFGFLGECDLVLSLGARLDYRVDYLSPAAGAGAKLIHVADSPDEIGRDRDPDLVLVGNCASVLGQLAEALPDAPAPRHTRWRERMAGHRRGVLDGWKGFGGEGREGRLSSVQLCEGLAPLVRDPETVFLLDGGNIGRWIHLLLFDRHPARWLTCGASGVVGYGIPGAIAARTAYPDRPVLLLSGDGSAGFGIMEVATALRHDLNFTAVIASDRAWGIVADQHPVTTHLGTIRYDRVAEALGARGELVSDPDRLTTAVRRGLERDGVTVILVPIEHGGISAVAERSGPQAGD